MIMKPVLGIIFLSIACLFLFTSCSGPKHAAKPTLADANTFLLTEISTDKSYGYTENNPIKVGGQGSGPANERRFLNALAGPDGEQITYVRLGSCCMFKTKNGMMGTGLLDKYQIEWKSQSEPVILYLNMYDYDALKAPIGFTIKSSQKEFQL